MLFSKWIHRVDSNFRLPKDNVLKFFFRKLFSVDLQLLVICYYQGHLMEDSQILTKPRIVVTLNCLQRKYKIRLCLRWKGEGHHSVLF